MPFRRMSLSLFVLIALIAINSVKVRSQPTTIERFVNSTAPSTTNCGKSRQDACRTIADALKYTPTANVITLVYKDTSAPTSTDCSNPYEHIVTIKRSVTIQADATPGNGMPCFLASSESSIVIDDHVGLTANVILKGLRFVRKNGQVGPIAISVKGLRKLEIENCVFENVGNGITFARGEMIIKSSTFDDNVRGIMVAGTGGMKTVTIDGCTFTKITTAGVQIGSKSYVIVKNSKFTDFKGAGSAIWVYERGSKFKDVTLNVEGTTTVMTGPQKLLSMDPNSTLNITWKP